MKRFKRIMPLLLALVLAASMPVQAADIALTITGDGVERETVFTLAELTAMTADISQDAYSAWNTWPAKKIYYAQGVSLAALLNRAGLKNSATTINIAAAPDPGASVGYNMTFLLDDLLAERYTYEASEKVVPAIIAFKLGERDFGSMDEADMRLIHGQLDPQEQTTAGFVQSVRVITVTCEPVRQLPQPEASATLFADGQYSIALTASDVNAKIYYTTDGSTPTVHSKMYNVSAPHWQPQLNVPFTVSGSTPVKTIAVASGFADSAVLSFTPASLNEDGANNSGMAHFVKKNSYNSGQFSDVDENQWYRTAIADAFAFDLMRGVSDTSFNPTGSITVAEVVTIAARVHSIYVNSQVSSAQTGPWYQGHVDYCIANGIISANDFTDYNRAVTRAEMAYIFSRALPQSEFKAQNTVDSLPDVTSATPYHDSIIMLYNAGVLTGSDAQGTFYPDRNISRAEAAAIISRVVQPDTRASGRTF